MNLEYVRLQTFINWSTDAPVEDRRIAKAGFYATGNELEVQCHWCQLKIHNWVYCDQVMSKHRILSPDCPFVIDPINSGNVPLQSQQSATEIVPIELMNEQCRLATFQKWPVPFISPQSLAKAGFFYFNHTDHVRCAWCQGAIAKWEIGDNPFTEHLRFFPQCSRAQLGPNVELQSEESIRSLGIQQIRPPKKERYSSLDARIRSFNNWPMAAIQAPETLAMAGFYYQNTDDQVLCFQCNGGLRSWQPEDDAWFEHARWFPKCEFVQLVKGQQYIAQVQAQTRPTIDEAMASEAVQKALQMGLNENHIQCVTKYHLEHFDGPFKSAEALVDIVLDYQRELEQLQNCDEENAVSSQNNSLENGHHINQILDKIFKKNRISPIQSSSTSSNTSFTNSDVSTDENESGTEDFVVLQRPQTLRRRTSSDLLVENQNVLPMHHSTSPTQYIANRSDTSENRNLSRSLSINMHVEPSSSCTNVIPKCNLESPSESIASNASNATSTSATTVQTLLLKEKIGLSLEEENRQLKDARLCKVCMDDDVAVVFLPCGHLVTCVQCAPSVTVCPLCRTAIKAFVRTFLS